MNPVEGQFQPLDAQLMLLAADELPAGEAQALRERILADLALAARFDALTEEMGGVEALLASADRARPVSWSGHRVAQQEANRAVEAWLVQDVAAKTRVVAPSAIEAAVWRYARWPLAAAAAVVVGLILLPSILDLGDQRGLRADRPSEEAQGGGLILGEATRGLSIDTLLGVDPREMHPREVGVPLIERDMPSEAGPADTGERLALLFDNPAGQWDVDGDGNFLGLDLQSDLRDELATLRALGDAWSDDGF